MGQRGCVHLKGDPGDGAQGLATSDNLLDHLFELPISSALLDIEGRTRHRRSPYGTHGQSTDDGSGSVNRAPPRATFLTAKPRPWSGECQEHRGQPEGHSLVPHRDGGNLRLTTAGSPSALPTYLSRSGIRAPFNDRATETTRGNWRVGAGCVGEEESFYRLKGVGWSAVRSRK